MLMFYASWDKPCLIQSTAAGDATECFVREYNRVRGALGGELAHVLLHDGGERAVSFRKSLPPQNHQLIVFVIVNNKFTISWGH